MPPRVQPIGRHVGLVAKALDRAFSAALTQAGGSQPMWLVLLALTQQEWRTQQDLAAEVGIEGPTLTHHLDRLEAAGLIVRERDREDRRAVRVRLTPAGDERFAALRGAAVAFDARLRAGLREEELDDLRALLSRLRDNVAPAGPEPRDGGRRGRGTGVRPPA